MAAGNTHLSGQEHVVTAKTATVTTWPIREHQMMTKTKPSTMQVSGSDGRTSALEEGGGAVAEWVRAFDRRPDGRRFESHFGKTFRFGTLATPFTPLCQCLSEETVKAVVPSIWCLCQGK